MLKPDMEEAVFLATRKAPMSRKGVVGRTILQKWLSLTRR
jgi:hypothetical protein